MDTTAEKAFDLPITFSLVSELPSPDPFNVVCIPETFPQQYHLPKFNTEYAGRGGTTSYNYSNIVEPYTEEKFVLQEARFPK